MLAVVRSVRLADFFTAKHRTTGVMEYWNRRGRGGDGGTSVDVTRAGAVQRCT